MIEKRTFRMISEADGLPIEVLATFPEGKEKAVVQLAHGTSEYKERYLPFMEYLSENGFLCVLNDHRGHGKSVKSREDLGYFGKNGGEALVEDMHQLTLMIREELSKAPLFLFGHSMGSLAVRCYTRKYDRELSGLVVCGCPSKASGLGAAELLLKGLTLVKGEHGISKALTNALIGSYNKPFAGEGRKNAWLSTNVENVEAYNRDPLCGFDFTLNGYAALLTLLQNTYQESGWQMENPDLPVLFISGAQDPCRISDGDFDNAVEFMKSRGYHNVSSRLYPGMRHEILNETEKEKVWKDVETYLEGILSAN